MLSEIVARRVALAFNPATLAFSEEEIVIVAPFCCFDTFVARMCSRGLKMRITPKG
jgi:hypothetical protein